MSKNSETSMANSEVKSMLVPRQVVSNGNGKYLENPFAD